MILEALKRRCVCCDVKFFPEGKENICEQCSSGEALKRECLKCGADFEADDPFDVLCSFCYDTNHLSD